MNGTTQLSVLLVPVSCGEGETDICQCTINRIHSAPYTCTISPHGERCESASETDRWRRVSVSAAVRLDRLHEVIQAAMGWQNAHLHAFIDGQTYYGVPDAELRFRDEWHNQVELPGEAGEQCLKPVDEQDQGGVVPSRSS